MAISVLSSGDDPLNWTLTKARLFVGRLLSSVSGSSGSAQAGVELSGDGAASCDQVGDDLVIAVKVAFAFAEVANFVALGQHAPDFRGKPERVREHLTMYLFRGRSASTTRPGKARVRRCKPDRNAPTNEFAVLPASWRRSSTRCCVVEQRVRRTLLSLLAPGALSPTHFEHIAMKTSSR
jgi:hypothetical protein